MRIAKCEIVLNSQPQPQTSESALRISHFALRMSHFALRTSHFALRISLHGQVSSNPTWPS